MKKTLLATALVANSVVITAPVLAQSLPAAQLLPNLETIVVVSSRVETPLREVATSVSVLDDVEIKARGFSALADVLRTLPSVTVSNAGGVGKTSSIRIRGEEGYRTLVRVDGVDISDPTGTQASVQIQHLLSANVARVELLRGPQGLMYGADAGGVINISTRQAEPGWQAQLAAEAGSMDSSRLNASAGAAGEALDFYVSVAEVDTDGFNTHLDDTELQDKDGYKNTTLHGRFGWQITDSLRLEAVARDTGSTSEFDQCGYPVTIDDCTGDYDQTNARVSVSHALDWLNNTLAYSTTDVERTSYDADVVSYFTEGTISKWELNGSAELSAAHRLAYGLEQRTDEVMAAERGQQSAYLEYQGSYADAVYVTAGVREDDNDDFGSHTSYRVSGAYLLDVSAGTIKFKTSYGTGFRAPSLFEIDYNNAQENPTLLPLQPEESEGLDAGVEYFANSGLHLEAVWFDQRITDEISFDLIGYTGYMQQPGESRSTGVELIADMPVADTLVINANYTWIDATARDDSPRSRQPEHMVNLGFIYTPIESLQASVNVRAAEGAEDRGVPLSDYQVVDASVRYRVLPQLTVYARGENIFDKDYIEVPGYRSQGAAVYGGVEVSF